MTYSVFQVTHSSGNHGQALAWAAKTKHLKCTVVAPNNSPSVKLQAIRGYGADVVLCDPTPASRYTVINSKYLMCIIEDIA